MENKIVEQDQADNPVTSSPLSNWSRISLIIKSRGSRYYLPLLGYGLALIIIYMSILSVPTRKFTTNNYTFDEPIWLSHSVCTETVFTGRYPEACKEISFQALDHSAGAKYILGLIRGITGIPADVVKYYYHVGANIPAVDPPIRDTIVSFLLVLSSAGLLILFVVLKRSFGYGAAITSLILIVITPYWLKRLGPTEAEPSLVFFSFLTWGLTLWLGKLLAAKQPKPLPLILFATICTSVALGYSIGIKANAASMAVGFAAVLFYAGFKTKKQWLLLVWLASLSVVIVTLIFLLTNPFLWDKDFFERLKLFVLIRPLWLFSLSRGNINAPFESLRDSFTNSFSADAFLPLIIDLPLCLLGIWSLRRYRGLTFRISLIWLVSTGVANSFVAPLVWAHYFIYIVLLADVLIGLGIWYLIQLIFIQKERLSLFNRSSNNPEEVAILSQRRHLGLFSKLSIVICLLFSLITLAVAGYTSLRVGKERVLWEKYILSVQERQTLSYQIQLLNEIVTQNPKSRLMAFTEDAGKPMLEVLQDYFEKNLDTTDPALLQMLKNSGQLLIKYSDNSDLRARISYELNSLGWGLAFLNNPPRQVGTFINETPANLIPASWGKNKGDQVLIDAKYPLRATIEVPYESNYSLRVTGLNTKSYPAQIDVSIDGVPAGKLSYKRQDEIWTEEIVYLKLTAGSHTVEFWLPKNLDPKKLSDVAAIRSFNLSTEKGDRLCLDTSREPETDGTLPTIFCNTGEPAVTLGMDTNTRQISFSVSLPSLYESRLLLWRTGTKPEKVQIWVDGRPEGGIFTIKPESKDPNKVGALYLDLPLLYLKEGSHSLKLERLTPANELSKGSGLVFSRLELNPQYPKPNILTPARFGSPDANTLTLKNNSQVSASWVQYGINYSFYNIMLSGGTEGIPEAEVEVSMDNLMVGKVKLDQIGSKAISLTVEIANGATHTLSLHPVNLPEGAKILIYNASVQPSIISNGVLFAATRMRWDKHDNSSVVSQGSMVQLPANVRLTKTVTVTKTVTIGGTELNNITVRVRNLSASTTPAKLHLGVGGWPLQEVELPNNTAWTDQVLTAYLTPGEQDLQIWWEGGNVTSSIEVMYVKVEVKAPDSANKETEAPPNNSES
ncbi:MAG: hypothetical protein WCS37_01810 [Chloroflexota bacterium]